MAETSSGERARVEAAVRDQYEDTSNFANRRALGGCVVDGRAVRERFVELFEWPEGATVLDVGCGDGVWAALAADAAGGPVLGIDASYGMLRDVGARDPRVLRVQGDGNALPLRDAAADVVLALFMLYHVELSRAAPEIARVLRPGGRLIAATSDESLFPGVEDEVHDAAAEVLGRRVTAPLGRLRFNVENGRELLAPYFASVEEIVDEATYEMTDVAPLLAFMTSLRGPATARLGDAFDFDAFLAAVRARLDVRLHAGPIRFTRRTAVFLARPD